MLKVKKTKWITINSPAVVYNTTTSALNVLEFSRRFKMKWNLSKRPLTVTYGNNDDLSFPRYYIIVRANNYLRDADITAVQIKHTRVIYYTDM